MGFVAIAGEALLMDKRTMLEDKHHPFLGNLQKDNSS